MEFKVPNGTFVRELVDWDGMGGIERDILVIVIYAEIHSISLQFTPRVIA